MATKNVIADSEAKEYSEEFLKNYQHNEEKENNFINIIPNDALTNDNLNIHSQTGMLFIITNLQ